MKFKDEEGIVSSKTSQNLEEKNSLNITGASGCNCSACVTKRLVYNALNLLGGGNLLAY